MRPKARTRFLIPAFALALAAAILPNGAAYSQASAPFIQIPAEAGYRAVLERHGQFYSHTEYGVVWLPSSMPQGWRPYSDCAWVKHAQYGWYYDDKSEWGRIVHHYGRWAHDERVGWMWIPGAEWSPGWVVWRTGETHVGWAPMPPDADVAKISVEQFNSDKHWMFREAASFKAGCANATPTAPADLATFRNTRVVTQTRFVNGVFIYDVPIEGVIVTFDVGVVLPWSPGFVGAIFGHWNRIWNDVTGQAALLNAALNQCTVDKPDRKLNLPFLPRPPAPPAPPRRADLPPSPPPVVAPPVLPPRPPVVVSPPVVTLPPVVTIPPIVIPPIKPDRPTFPPRPPRGDANPPPPKFPPVKPPRETVPVRPPKLPPVVKVPTRVTTPPVITRTVPRTAPLHLRSTAPVLRQQTPRFVAPKFTAPRPTATPMLRAQPRAFGGRPRLF